MLAYKGFDAHLKGHGGFQFRTGKTYTEKESKTARTGFHCAEYPFICCNYFPVNKSNRFFLVEIGGDIDEDEDERISATTMTLKKELTMLEFAGHGMAYMICHPQRKWEYAGGGVVAAKDKAEGKGAVWIAVARGEDPVAAGVKGTVLGLMRERDGRIDSARIVTVGKEGIKPNVWYGLSETGEVIEHDP